MERVPGKLSSWEIIDTDARSTICQVYLNDTMIIFVVTSPSFQFGSAMGSGGRFTIEGESELTFL